MTTTEIKDEPGVSATPQNDDSTSNVSKATSARKAARVDTTLDHRDKETFYKDLMIFHENRNTTITRFPKVNGKEVDLHKLYGEVISRGGWLKVNIRNEWDDLVPVLDLNVKCVNASVALKHIYTRFLDKFEKANFLGEDPDKHDETEEESRHKKWSSKTFHSVPMTYNYSQHNVTEQVRVMHKLSTDLYKSSEYEKLLLSLISPLPNEQDFAINVCTLMANESKHTLKIDHCPKLLDALIAHAGVYCHFTMRDLFYELYTKIRRHSLQAFWNDCLHDKPQILELSYDDYFQSPDDKFGDSGAGRPPLRLPQREEFHDGLNASHNEVRSDYHNLDFLALGRGLGTHDYVGQRINQVASIIRNLSFFEENAQTLAKNRTFIRFLVMCSNIRWGNIHHMALDVCGNIATELELTDPTSDDLTRCLMSTICEGLEGHDRGVVINCLEILHKLCQKDSNEEHIHKCLDQRVYDQICLFLSLNDIMLLLYTLECIYALSSLGHRSCNQLIQVRGVVDSLVSLITVEAQSYGPDGCILMRVVETVPGNMLPMVAQNIAKLQNAALAGQVGDHIHQTSVISLGESMSCTNSNDSQNSYFISEDCILGNEINQTSTPPPPTSVRVVQTSQSPSSSATQSSPSLSITPSKPTQQQQQQDAEQFVVAWLGANFEVVPSVASRIDQQDLFKMYLSAAQKSGRRCVSQASFPRLVRTTFTGQVGPSLVKTTESNGSVVNNYYYIRLRARANPLPIKAITNVKQGGDVTPKQKQTKKVQMQQQKQLHKSPVVVTQQQPQQQVSGQHVANQGQIQHTQHAIQQQHTLVSQQSLFSQMSDIQSPTKLSGKNIVMNKTLITTQHQATPQIVSPNTGTAIVAHTATSSNILSHTQQQILKTGGVIQTGLSSPSSSNANGNGAASSLIKSLLANKVTTTATEVSESNASAAPNNPSCLITQNVNMHQVAQRQHLQKQKELAQQQQQQQNAASIVSSIKSPVSLNFPTTTINALVNNPVIQSTAVKVGQTTIKAINSNTAVPSIIEKKTIQSGTDLIESLWEPVPPLMPISGSSIRHQNSNIILGVTSEDSNSTGNNSFASSVISSAFVNTLDECEGSEISFEGLLMQNSKSGASSIIEDDNSKDSLNRPSHVLNANQMLVDLLDKKSPDPPLSAGIKRKLDDDLMETDSKRLVLEEQLGDIEDDDFKVTPSKNAANLYAEMAASILEDEDLEEDGHMQSHIATSVQAHVQAQIASQVPAQMQTPVIQKTADAQKQLITMPMPMQRQIIVAPNSPHQVILSQAGTNSQPVQTQATATIKTESGLQTVPLILQKQVGPGGQQIIQPVLQSSQSQTQYVLATNPQGQTYLVAQQPQPTQTVLVTQTPQQQGTPSKTIIILQQQGSSAQAVAAQQQLMGAPGTPQKVIMTTPQGQQMIVTQVPRPVQHQIVMNHPTTNALQSTTQANVVFSQSQQSIHQQQVQSHLQAQQHQQMQKQIQIQTQSQVQIQSNSHQSGEKIVLSQLPHIPATIKLHPHQSQNTQTQTIPKLMPAKTPPMQMSQQQQQQLIQSHCKGQDRKIFFTGNTAVELSEQSTQSVSSGTQTQQHPTPPQTPALQQTPPPNLASTPPLASASQSPGIIAPPPPPASIKPTKTIADIKTEEELIDPNWLWICDWRNCPRKKFKSLNDVYRHACIVHCPESLDPSAEIYCQWGPGPSLCDNIPRKRFSLMTHLLDRHCTTEAFKAAVQRRILTGIQPSMHTQPVTIIKNAPNPTGPSESRGTASPALSTSSTSSLPPSASAAMHAIKRHTADFANPKELMDENEGPVTKSIRLTAALILRNLVTYTSTAKKNVRCYEPHLAGVALSNVESSQAISQILYEMNN